MLNPMITLMPTLFRTFFPGERQTSKVTRISKEGNTAKNGGGNVEKSARTSKYPSAQKVINKIE